MTDRPRTPAFYPASRERKREAINHFTNSFRRDGRRRSSLTDRAPP